MKILQVNKFNYIRGGAEKYFIEISRELEKAGHQVAVFSMNHPKNFKSAWSKYFVSRISFSEHKFKNIFLIPFRVLYSLEAKKKFEKLIKKFKPDVIHVHNIYHQISPSILPLAKKYKIPVIMHLHDYKLICPNYQLFVNNKICYRCRGGKYYNCLKYKCFKKSFWQSLLATIEMYIHHKVLNIYKKNISHFIAPSNFIRETMISFGISRKKISVIYNFSNDTSNNKLEYTGNSNYILYFGRLSKEKGLKVLLRSLKLTKSKVAAVIIGSGPEEELLKDYSQNLNLKNRVKFLGYKTGDELKSFIVRAKAIVVPSIWAENMPFSLIEALQMGKVVIASNVGGIPELIKNKQTGFLFKKGSSNDLAKKIDNLDAYDLKKIEKQAMKRVEKLNINNHLENILNVYKKYIK